MKKVLPFLGITDKAAKVYSKFTYREFWEFTNPGETEVYELRLRPPKKKDLPRPMHEYIQEAARRAKAPCHWTGVFVRTADQFWIVACYAFKQKLTLYISANPKKKSYHPKDRKSGLCYNGMKQSEKGIYTLLIDFDPSAELKSDGVHDSSEACYRVAKKFLDANPKIKKYCLLSSGNGVQLRIPFDNPIPLPKDTYDVDGTFVETEEWATYSRLLKVAFGPDLGKYETPDIKPDTTSLELARVGRAPFSGNWKNPDQPRMAGIIEIVDEGENYGLYDYAMNFYDQVFRAEQSKQEYVSDATLAEELNCNEHTLVDSKLAKLLLTEGLPEGGRNNTLFFQFKLLIKANGLSPKNEHVARIIRYIERAQKDKFPTNEPAGHMRFHPEAIINWCIDHRWPPIYEPLYYRPRLKRVITTEDLQPPKAPGPEKLPAERTFTSQLKSYLEANPISWQIPDQRRKDCQKLLRAIKNTKGKDFLDYLLAHNVLKTILAKI